MTQIPTFETFGNSHQRASFAEMDFPVLKRKGAENNEYYVFVDEKEFKTVQADTVVLAIEKGEVPAPYKVVPAHRRIHDIIRKDNLEFVGIEHHEGHVAEEAVASTEHTDMPQTAPEAAPPSESPPSTDNNQDNQQ